MASRSQQEILSDDSDDTCPLCVEELDLSDKNFKPCPCGYQVCQFCFNNIKNNLNGLCPACRRPYDDKTIEWKVVSPEEFKADVQAQARRKAAARQKEAERRQVETLNRKHLAGLRVLQRNLVYVMGMDTGGAGDDTIETLKGPQHFGQYGKIIKLAISKAKEGYGGHHSVGIYVTFANKDDAKDCINALDGRLHNGRVLRAQYGTTKYCSAFLRNETCTNRGCTFLHETGDESESFSRQDLSLLNAASTQRPVPSSAAGPSKQSHQLSPRVSAAQPVLAQSASLLPPKPESMVKAQAGEVPALPTAANWAKNPQVEQAKQPSQIASRETPSPPYQPSPVVPEAKPMAPARPESRATKSVAAAAEGEAQASRKASQDTTRKAQASDVIKDPSTRHGLEEAMKAVTEYDWVWSLDRRLLDAATLSVVDNYPPLIDVNGGYIRFRLKRDQEEEQQKRDREPSADQDEPVQDEEENFASGSLQLGGEPEPADHGRESLASNQLSRRNGQKLSMLPPLMGQSQPFDGQVSLANEFSSLSFGDRSLTPQQQRNVSLLKPNDQHPDSMLEQFQRSTNANGSQHQSQLSNPFQAQNQQLSALSRHSRQSSRYMFANDTASGATAVRPVGNAHIIAQQQAVLPQNQQNKFGTQSAHLPSLHTNYYSNVQGPPPGLKSSGTPPVSGGGMFGQGHGFANAAAGSLGFGAGNTAKQTSNEDMVRDFMRGRGGVVGGMGSDPGKRESSLFSISKPAPSPSPISGTQRPLPSECSLLAARQPQHASVKSKKKSKRNRHANTASSSVGGGFVVDLSDPSILQARMHHAGVGQGQFNGTQQQESIILDVSDTGPTKKLSSRVQIKSRSDVPSPSNPPGLSLLDEFPPLKEVLKDAHGPQQPPSTIPLAIATVPLARVERKNEKSSTSTSGDKGASDAAPVKAVLEPNVTSSRTSGVVKEKQADDAQQSILQNKRSSQPTLDSETRTKAADEKISGKRNKPGKLDILAATSRVDDSNPSQPTQDFSRPSTPKQVHRRQPQSANTSQPPSPGTTVSQSPVSSVSQQPRTLRLVTKQDSQLRNALANISAPAPSPSTSTRDTVAKGSPSNMRRPRSPAPETFDNTSARPVSAPTKKERQAAAKQKDVSKLGAESASPSAPEIIQAPIIGRKKKKEKKTKVTADESAPNSALESPQNEPDQVKEDVSYKALDDDPTSARAIDEPLHSAISETTDDIVQESTDNVDKLDESESTDEKKPNVAAVLTGLAREGVLKLNDVSLFSNIPGISQKYDFGDSAFPDRRSIATFSTYQRGLLDHANALVVPITDRNQAVVLPDRSILRYFSAEEAQRYLELRKSLMMGGALDLDSPHLFFELPTDAWVGSSGEIFTESSHSTQFHAEDGEEAPGPEEMVNEYASMIMRPEPGEYGGVYAMRGRPPNDGLSGRIATMTTEESDAALRESEEVISRARKNVESLEKKLMQIVKKNRKQLKDWL